MVYDTDKLPVVQFLTVRGRYCYGSVLVIFDGFFYIGLVLRVSLCIDNVKFGKDS